MPTVPRIESGQVRVSKAPNVQNTAAPSLENFGAGRAFGEQVSVVQNILQDAKNNADQLAVLEADKQLASVQSAALYDPLNGLYVKKGKQAFTALDETLTTFNNSASDIENSLTNANQKAAFRKMYFSRQEDINRQAQKHVGSEITQYDNQLTESYIINEREAASQNPYDKQRIASSLENQKQAYLTFAKRNGVPDELVSQKLQELSSTTHSSVVEKFLARGKDLEAKAYYEATKDQYTSKDATRIDKDVRLGSLMGESQRMGDEIFKKYRDSYSGALSALDGLKDDPELKKMTKAVLEQNFASQDRARADAAEKNNIRAAALIDAGEKVPPQYLNQMTTSQRSEIERYAKTKAKGGEPETSWKDYYDLYQLPKESFVRIDLYGGYRNKLDNEKFAEVTKLQQKLREGDEKAAKILDGFQSDQQVVDGVLERNGFNLKSNAGNAQKDAIAEFKRQVDDRVIKQQAITGKKVTNDEIEKISNDLMVKGTTSGGFLGMFKGEKRAFQKLPTEPFEVLVETIKDVPTSEQKKIIDAMKRNGKPITDKMIIDLYKQRVSNGLK